MVGVLTVKNPIKEIGKECPQAFVQYSHTKETEAKHLQEILENSSSPTGVTYFCEYFLCLLNHGIKQHKEKVICLIGEPNSGKTAYSRPSLG